MKWKIFALSLLLVAAPSAHAYLDPGSGSAILQGIIGALAAIGITLKLYWHRILRFLGIRKASNLQEDDETAKAPSTDTSQPGSSRD
ncbi:MAG: hypothetical protein RQ847_12065 [Wenzhouxiangellaceae bacterium]|nr:hypothetical protein [Wenzhouxiangellaceae bacterium]